MCFFNDTIEIISNAANYHAVLSVFSRYKILPSQFVNFCNCYLLLS